MKQFDERPANSRDMAGGGITSGRGRIIRFLRLLFVRSVL